MAGKKKRRKDKLGTDWTQAEEERLRRLFPLGRNDELAARFNRSRESIKKKARKLGLKKDYAGGYRPYRPDPPNMWTKDDIRRLKKMYPEVPVKQVAKILKRSETAVISKAGDLGIKKKFRIDRRHWSKEELRFLKKNFPEMDFKTMAKKLGRSHSAVRSRANKLGLRSVVYWTEKEDALLKRQYLRSDVKDVTKKLGRTASSVKSRALKLGLLRLTLWTEKEIWKLHKLYQTHTLDEIAERIDRPLSAIKAQAKRQKLRRSMKWTQEEMQLLKQYYPHQPSREVAEMLGIPVQQVTAKANQLGIYKTKKYLRSIGKA